MQNSNVSVCFIVATCPLNTFASKDEISCLVVHVPLDEISPVFFSLKRDSNKNQFAKDISPIDNKLLDINYTIPSFPFRKQHLYLLSMKKIFALIRNKSKFSLQRKIYTAIITKFIIITTIISNKTQLYAINYRIAIYYFVHIDKWRTQCHNVALNRLE